MLGKWYLWTVLPLLTGIIVYLYLLSRPDQFISDATLYLNLPTEKSIALTEDIFEQNEFDRYIQNLLQISQSTRNVDRVRLLILKNYIQGERLFITKPIPGWLRQDSAFTMQHVNEFIEQAKAMNLRTSTDARLNAFLVENGYSRKNVRNTIETYRGQSTNYFIVQSQASDPFRAAKFTSYAANSLIYIEKRRDQKLLRANQKTLEEMVAEARQKLNQELTELETYKVNNIVINLDEHTKAIVNELVQLQKEKAKLLESIASSQQTIDEVTRILKDDGELPIINTQVNDSLVTIQNKLDEIEQSSIDNKFIRMDSISVQDVDQLVARSKKLRQRMDQQINNFIQDTPIDYRSARQQQVEKYLDAQVTLEISKRLIPLVEKEIERMRQSASHFAPIESTISTLEDEIVIAQESYLLLLNKLDNLKSKTRDGISNQLQIYEGPTIPQIPIGSGNKLLSAASSIGVFVLILLFIGLIEYLDQGIWDAMSFKRKTGKKIASFLPHIDFRRNSEEIEALQKIYDSQITYLLNLLVNQTGQHSFCGLISGDGDENVTHIYNVIEKRAQKAGLKITYINFTEQEIPSKNSSLDDIKPVDPLLIPKWMEDHKAAFKGYDSIFMLLPSYKTDFTNRHIENYLDAISIIFKAGFVVSPIDIDFLSRKRQSAKTYPLLIDIPSEYLDVMTGPLDKPRSVIRSFFKDIIHGKLKR